LITTSPICVVILIVKINRLIWLIPLYVNRLLSRYIAFNAKKTIRLDRFRIAYLSYGKLFWFFSFFEIRKKNDSYLKFRIFLFNKLFVPEITFREAVASTMPKWFSATHVIRKTPLCVWLASVMRKKLTLEPCKILYFLLCSFSFLLFFFHEMRARGKLNTWHSNMALPLTSTVELWGFKLTIFGGDSPLFVFKILKFEPWAKNFTSSLKPFK